MLTALVALKHILEFLGCLCCVFGGVIAIAMIVTGIVDGIRLHSPRD